MNNSIPELLRKLTFVDEEYITTKASRDSQKRHTYYGLTIFVTGVFAMISGGLALSYVFYDSPLIVFPVAIFWGIIIMIIDRGIIGAKSNGALWFRGLFAIIIAISVSIPLELRIMEGKIDALIADSQNEFEIDRNQRLNSLDSLSSIKRNDIFENYTIHNDAFLENQRKAKMELGNWDPDKEQFITAGPGDRHKAYSDKAKAESEKANLYESELMDFDAKNIEKRQRILDEKPPEIANDLLDRYIMMQVYKNTRDSKGRLTSQAKAAIGLSWILKAIFFMVELLPLTIKFFFVKSDYDETYIGLIKDFEKKFEQAKKSESERVTNELINGTPIDEIVSISNLFAFLENNKPFKKT